LCIQVRISEVAVVTLFGRIAQVNTNARRRTAFALSNLKKVFQTGSTHPEFRRQGQFEEIKLHDQNIIFLSVYVGFRISDPTNFFVPSFSTVPSRLRKGDG